MSILKKASRAFGNFLGTDFAYFTGWFVGNGALAFGIPLSLYILVLRIDVDQKHLPGIKVTPSDAKLSKLYDVVTKCDAIKDTPANYKVLRQGFTHNVEGFEVVESEKKEGYLKVNFSYLVEKDYHTFFGDRATDKKYKDTVKVTNPDIDVKALANFNVPEP